MNQGLVFTEGQAGETNTQIWTESTKRTKQVGQDKQDQATELGIWKWDTGSANTKDENRNKGTYKSRNSLWDGGEGKHSGELPFSMGASRHPTRPIIFTVELKVIKSRSRIKEWGTQEHSSGPYPPNRPGIGDLGPGIGHPPNAATYRQAGAMENITFSLSKALSTSGDQLKPVYIQYRSEFHERWGNLTVIPNKPVVELGESRETLRLLRFAGRPLHHGVVIFWSAFMLPLWIIRPRKGKELLWKSLFTLRNREGKSGYHQCAQTWSGEGSLI